MMTPQPSTPGTPLARVYACGEWVLVVGLAVTLAWTTLCLGGYMAKTMVFTAWAVFGLTALGGLLWVAGRGGEPLVFNRAALLPVPFLVYALVSVLWLAPAPWLAWREWLLWLQMWLVFVLALHFGRGRAQTWVVIGTFVLLGLAGTVMAAYQRFGDPSWMMLGRKQAAQFVGRSGGMFGIPNSLAGLLELMIPVCVALVFSRATRPGLKIVSGWLAVLFLFAVVLTGSRGGWIGLGLALMIWPLLSGRDWRRRLAGAALVLGLAVAGGAALYRFSDYARERIQPFLDGQFERSRPILWKAGVEIWREYPWVGTGAASYNVFFDQHRPRGFLNEPDWTHNDYLNTLSDYGLAGFALWAGAGAALLWLGWSAVRRARRETMTAGDLFALAKWKLGLLVGLLAFAIHLAVDFHTKLPALAFAAAVVAAWLVRDEPGLLRPVRRGWAGLAGVGLVIGPLLVGARVASPLYRAEALRFDARKSIDRYATTGQGNLRAIIPVAKTDFTRAVRIDPTNGQAWSELAYATVLGWSPGGDAVSLGRFAELAADEALKQCPINAEFWVRKGVALDLQQGRPEAESCFRRALELAPNAPAWWYNYAYHLSRFPSRKSDAMRAVQTCLTLDPFFREGEALRQKLVASH